MQGAWPLILDLLIALSGALLLGLLAERLRINSIIGYLIAGAVAGPSVLGLIEQGEAVSAIAEVGVALLLFTIGLEFSWKRLIKMGRTGLLGGVVTITVTLLVVLATCLAFGMSIQAAVVLGAAASLSSTAIVLRVMRQRNDLDTTHGRHALALLLMQDIAVVPLVLIVTFVSQGGSDVWSQVGVAVVKTVALVVGLVIFVSQVVPRLLDERIVARNRELPIILAIVTCVGATWAAHELKISPALGAFFAGILLAESKFSAQMRADVLPLRTLFVTLFFVSVGLTADLPWMGQNIVLVLAVSAGIMTLKTLATYFSLRPFTNGVIEVLAAALAVSQIGEFSFVLLNIGRESTVINDEIFQLFISVTMVTLLMTPLLTGRATKTARYLAIRFIPNRKLATEEKEAHPDPIKDHVIIIGYGEAGQATCESLTESGTKRLVIDLSPKVIHRAEQNGLTGLIGDATSAEILEHAHIQAAKAVLVAMSDHNISRMVVGQAKSLAPHVPVVVRSRYQVHAGELDMIGGDHVVDEEGLVGEKLASKILEIVVPNFSVDQKEDTSDTISPSKHDGYI
ncbi:MAG: cation:proton antiporter [Armatimonadetes bacterium]|nr:cation:proton antiporter [Armatimonadota bacterium]